MLLFMQDLAIILPCFNEENRLNIKKIKSLLNSLPNAKLFFVDDGSTDKTLENLKKYQLSFFSEQVKIISYPDNKGKSYAVREGVLAALQIDTKYIGFLDSDLSTPTYEFIRLYHHLINSKKKMICGSRVKKLNSTINRSLKRHIIGRIIATIIDKQFKLGIYDTQCGIKIFDSSIINLLFKEPFSTKWLFDVEIFLRLKNAGLINAAIEEPLNEWNDIPGSKLSFKNLFQIIKEIKTIKKKYAENRF
jgi:dolichyl-phosphate beta-glucosyltransferase